MKNQTKEIIDLNRTTLHEGLNRLEKEKVITQSENIQIYKRLSGDLDYYIDHQDIDFTQLKKKFFETIQSFDNIRINQSVFSEISLTYHCITSQIMMRHYPIRQEDYVIQSKLNKVMNDWFENYQSDSEKISDLIALINREKQAKIYADISPSEYDDIISTISRIKNDTTISKDELKTILMDGMHKYCNRSHESNLNILNIYETIDRIKKLGIDKQLSAIYESKHTKPEEPSYSEIKQQVERRFKILLNDEMITKSDYEKYTNTIIEDVNLCEKNTDKEKIKEQLLSSLKKLKAAELDSEDMEAIAGWYFILSQKSKIDIKTDLNKWLYDFDI